MKFDLKCTQHPKYQAKRHPYGECAACLTLYYLVHMKFRMLDDGSKLAVVKTRKKP
jgi:hypothetical protein